MDGSSSSGVNYPTQPMMMTFKNFLSKQDDNIDDEEAIKEYAAYKLKFKTEQLSKFFADHKDEEWFRSRYHPDEYAKRQQEIADGINKRRTVWETLLTSKYMKDLSVDLDKTGEIIRFLDAAVIKLEGGSDLDLTILELAEEPPPELGQVGKPKVSAVAAAAASAAASTASSTSGVEEDGAADGDEDAKTGVKAEKDVEMKEGSPAEGGSTEESRKRERSEEREGSASASEAEAKEKEAEEKGQKDESETEKEGEKAEGKVEEPVKMEEDKESSATAEESASKEEAEPSRSASPAAAAAETTPPSETATAPRPLHRTCSIFLRNLAPSITKQEVEAMCQKFPGYLRVAIADPQPERHFYRRGWVSFERIVNIKEICWNLNNIRLRDCDMGAIVNRDLSRRIRPVNGISQHKQVVKNDIRLAAKIVQNYDKRHNLFQVEETAENGKKNGSATNGMAFSSKNPLLKNITDYLVDEADAEEEELLGIDSDKPKTAADEINMDRDENLITVLDKLVFYLRIVHSFDYYNAIEYPNEDEMPNRCGIIHARGPDPSGMNPPAKITQTELTDWTSGFEKKITPFLEFKDKLDLAEAKKLGFKDEEVEVEKFIQANTEELAKDKWLCPLSGKKFKGPDFVRKHILNKHVEKIDEVKKEVGYFNNYLLDPKRPQLPEHPNNKPKSQGGSGGSGGPSLSSAISHAPPPPSDSYGGGGGYHRSHPSNDSYSRGGSNFPERSNTTDYHNSGYDRREPMLAPSYGGSHRGGGGGGHHGGGPGFNNHPAQNMGIGNDYQRGTGFRHQARPPPRGPYPDSRAIINYRDLDSPEDIDFA